MKRKISFTEARKIVRATHAPSTTTSYAAAVSVKQNVAYQTPQGPQQAVKPQPKGDCKGEHPAFSKKCPKFLKEKEIQSLRVKRKISFTEARKIVRATHAPSKTTSYAAAVSIKQNVACQTPQWTQQAVKPQPKEKALNQQGEKPKSQRKKASTTTSDRRAQSVNVGTDDKGKNTQLSSGPMPSRPTPGQSGSPSRIPVLTRGKSPPKTSGGRTTKPPPKTSGGRTKPLTPQGGEKDNQQQ